MRPRFVALNRRGANINLGVRTDVAVDGDITSASPPSFAVTDPPHQITFNAFNVNGDLINPITVAYSTSNVAVVTVSAGGLVTPIGAGSANITLKADGWTVAVPYTVASPASTVHHVTVSPLTLSIVNGGGGQLTATAFDVLNNVLLGRVMTWADDGANTSVSGDSGSDPHHCTVTGTGVGAQNVTATCETVASTAPCVVTVSAPGTTHPHEPVGATQKWHHTFGTILEDGSHTINTVPTLAADASFLVNGRKMEIIFQQGVAQGQGTTGAVYKDISGQPTRLYYHLREFGFTSGLCANSTGKNVLWINGEAFFFNVNGPGPANGFVGPISINPRIQGQNIGASPGGSTHDYGPGLTLTADTKYDIEIDVQLSTAVPGFQGASHFDGSFTWWAKLSSAPTFTLMGTFTGLKTQDILGVNPANPTHPWQYVGQVRTFAQNGGNDVTPPTTGYWFYGDIYASTLP